MSDGNEIVKHMDLIANLQEEVNALHTAKRNLNDVIRSSEARQKVISAEVTELETRKTDAENSIAAIKKEVNLYEEKLKKKSEELGSILAEIHTNQNLADQTKMYVHVLQERREGTQTVVDELEITEKHLNESITKHKEDLFNLMAALESKTKAYTETLEKYNVLELKFNNLDSDYKKKVAQLEAELQKKKDQCSAYDVGKIMQDFEVMKQGLENDFEARKRQVENDIANLNKGIEKAVEEFELKKLQFVDVENKHNDLLIEENKKLLEVKRERAEIEAENKRKKAQEIINTLK